MKKYKIKKSPELIKKLVPFWKLLRDIEGLTNEMIDVLEKKMEREVGIKDIWFFRCMGEYCGIGTHRGNMELIHDVELEK